MTQRFQLFLSAAALSLAALTVAVAPAAAWAPPSVGKACPGTRGSGAQQVAIAGNYLGGRPIRDGIVDRKSFQACFATLGHCEHWLAGKARAYPLTPGFARCTPVVVR